ncbi:hypothetical protein BS47DRAFT_1351704, partial [Hydnum rufescens UP504]
MEEMFAWQETQDPQGKTFDEYHSAYPSLKEIGRRLYGKPINVGNCQTPYQQAGSLLFYYWIKSQSGRSGKCKESPKEL